MGFSVKSDRSDTSDGSDMSDKSDSSDESDFDGNGGWRLLLGEFLGRFGYGWISWSGENCVNLRVKWKLRVGL